MTQPAKWFERTFDFAFPAELYPNIAMRLRGTPARLEEMLSGCSQGLLTQRANEAWSIQEHAGHLADLEPLWRARVADFRTGALELTIADLTNLKTHEAQHNARPLSEILADFRHSRAALLAALETLDPAALPNTIPHPRLRQPMRLVDHLFFVAEHDDHHLARMWQLIAAR
jgi:uncharacterized damage-inducible protein DinB